MRSARCCGRALPAAVLWPLAEFECPDEQALYDGSASVPWHEHLREGDTVAVDAHVSGEAITHARFAAQRVKDAVVDVFRAQGLERPSVDVDAPDLRLNLSLRKGRATLSVDLGGGPLHRRGWRASAHEAPLKENLAAAVLLRGGWPNLYAAEGGALLDPMCGSGTLLIEGALMAADVAPGLGRMQAAANTEAVAENRRTDAVVDGPADGAAAPANPWSTGLAKIVPADVAISGEDTAPAVDTPSPTRWTGFDAAGWAALVAAARTRAQAGLTRVASGVPWQRPRPAGRGCRACQRRCGRRGRRHRVRGARHRRRAAAAGTTGPGGVQPAVRPPPCRRRCAVPAPR